MSPIDHLVLEKEPGCIPGYYDSWEKRVRKENQVTTIEPFLSTCARQVFDVGDGWKLQTSKKYLTAQYEHSLVIT